ncbi:Uncharacterised protein [Mycobacteroides abscessus subsp. abscessus]|nr:Uncharacterised protein [Mycobacteroides abscessus subsp. abscessus]
MLDEGGAVALRGRRRLLRAGGQRGAGGEGGAGGNKSAASEHPRWHTSRLAGARKLWDCDSRRRLHETPTSRRAASAAAFLRSASVRSLNGSPTIRSMLNPLAAIE